MHAILARGAALASFLRPLKCLKDDGRWRQSQPGASERDADAHTSSIEKTQAETGRFAATYSNTTACRPEGRTVFEGEELANARAGFDVGHSITAAYRRHSALSRGFGKEWLDCLVHLGALTFRTANFFSFVFLDRQNFSDFFTAVAANVFVDWHSFQLGVNFPCRNTFELLVWPLTGKARFNISHRTALRHSQIAPPSDFSNRSRRAACRRSQRLLGIKLLSFVASTKHSCVEV
jgi:hypothetical protein